MCQERRWIHCQLIGSIGRSCQNRQTMPNEVIGKQMKQLVSNGNMATENSNPVCRVCRCTFEAYDADEYAIENGSDPDIEGDRDYSRHHHVYSHQMPKNLRVLLLIIRRRSTRMFKIIGSESVRNSMRALNTLSPQAKPELESHLKRYAANREVVIDGLKAMGVHTYAPPQGAFYIYVDLSGSLPLALPNSNNLPLCQWSQCEGRWADAHPHVDSSDSQLGLAMRGAKRDLPSGGTQFPE